LLCGEDGHQIVVFLKSLGSTTAYVAELWDCWKVYLWREACSLLSLDWSVKIYHMSYVNMCPKGHIKVSKYKKIVFNKIKYLMFKILNEQVSR
jgi:hypothetical protein